MISFISNNPLIQFILKEWALLLPLTIVFLVYFYYTSTYDHFEKLGVKYMKPVIFLGNLGSRLRAKTSFYDIQNEIYNYFKPHKYGGIFEGRRPILYIIDPDLIKAVLIRDFDHFADRNSIDYREPGYLRRSIINLKDKEWKEVRSIMTPSFSSARLKNMLPLLETCSQQMVDFLKQYDNKEVEMKNTMGHFTLEVIGACAFGIRSDALTDENAKFVEVAKKFDFMSKSKRVMVLTMMFIFPSLFRLLNITLTNPETAETLVKMLRATKAERKEANERKNDFLQLMIDAAEKEKKSDDKIKHLDDDTVDAQCFIFLIAGYETSSTLLSFASYVLATHPELQEKLRDHVVDVAGTKEMDYEFLSQLDYLDAFLLETLRLYSPASRIDRKCTMDYTLPGTNVTLKKGDIVAIAVAGLHNDPDIYPEPEKFRPERFMGDEKKDRPSHLFLAFGAGPRNCIGLRFAMLSAKVVMVQLLKNFRYSLSPKTDVPIQFDKRAILLKAANGVWVRLEKL